MGRSQQLSLEKLSVMGELSEKQPRGHFLLTLKSKSWCWLPGEIGHGGKSSLQTLIQEPGEGGNAPVEDRRSPAGVAQGLSSDV